MLKVAAKKIYNLLNVCKGIIKFLLTSLIVALVCIYYQTEIFNFQYAKVELDTFFYNPYANWKKDRVLKANFHAHAKAWKGITNGHNSEEELTNAYRDLDYQVAAVSNYHKVSEFKHPDVIKIPTYEHGYNVTKAHLLAIDASQTDLLDFPIGQSLSHKQARVLNIKKHASLVALAHPGVRSAFTESDLRQLKGYDLFEVLSPYFESFHLWDYALSQGNLSWLLANDDTHDLASQPAGRFFNVISALKKDKKSVIEALKVGNHVAYASEKGKTDVFLEYLKLTDQRLTYSFSGDIQNVNIVRNNKKYSIPSTGEISLVKNELFVRFEVKGIKSVLYTNPVYRISNTNLSSFSNITHTVNLGKTFLFRFNSLLVGSSLIFLMYWKKISGRFPKWKRPSFFWKKKKFVGN